MNIQIVLTIAIALCVLSLMVHFHLRKKRRERLMAKYGDAQIVEDIMNRQIWQNMSKDQLIESWGHPADTDRKLYKTKTAETYKYVRTGKNRFRDRVFLENEVVVGWKRNSN